MNQTFSLSRFGLLLRTYFNDNRGTLLGSILLLVSILSLMALFFYRGYPDDVDRNRFVIGLLLGWAAWYIFTVHQVSVLNEKDQAITYLLRPASILEKYLLILLVSGLGFVVVYMVVFTLVDALGVSYINHRSWDPEQLAIIRNMGGRLYIEPYYLSRMLTDRPTSITVFTVLLHPVTLAFALLIRRLSLPVVAIVVITLGVVGTLVHQYFRNMFFAGSDMFSGLPFSNMAVIRKHEVRLLVTPEPIGSQLRYIVGITVIVMLYITAYFRLKEREV